MPDQRCGDADRHRAPRERSQGASTSQSRASITLAGFVCNEKEHASEHRTAPRSMTSKRPLLVLSALAVTAARGRAGRSHRPRLRRRRRGSRAGGPCTRPRPRLAPGRSQPRRRRRRPLRAARSSHPTSSPRDRTTPNGGHRARRSGAPGRGRRRRVCRRSPSHRPRDRRPRDDRTRLPDGRTGAAPD